MRPFMKAGLSLAFFSALVGGDASSPVLGHVVYAHCPLDSHTEAFPRNRKPRHAYACRSNQSGFLSRDQNERMTPLPH
jgi:hypothetical protein